MALFGQTPQGIHLGLLCVNLATILLLFLLGKRICGLRAGAVASAAYALLSVSESVVGIAAHATHFVVLFAVAGFFMLYEALERDKPSFVFLSGLLLGISFTMKQHAAALVIFGFLYLVWRGWRCSDSGRKNIMAGIALFLLGTIIPYALIVLWLLRAGTFGTFWFWTVQYAREYTSMETLSAGLSRFFSQTADIVAPQFPLWLIAIAGGGLLMTRHGGHKRDRFFIFGMILFSFLAIFPGLYFREHYYVMVLPAIALLIGVAFQSATSLPALSGPGLFRQLLPLILVAGAVTFGFASERKYLFSLPADEVCRAIYGTNPFPEAVEVARYIGNHTSATDRIAVLGSEPEIFFYAGRLSATGHIYMYGLMENHPYAERMQLQAIREIETARPEYVVVVNVDTSWLVRPTSPKNILIWGEGYVRSRYNLEGIIDIIGPKTTLYMWGERAAGYKPVSNCFLTVFRRRT
jgi:hypothetical protein